MSVFKGCSWVYSKCKQRALPITLKVKKNMIKLNSILSKAPNINDVNMHAIVVETLTALTPSPTTLVGNSSTIYTKKRMNSVAIASLKKKITITWRTLSKQKSHSYGFLNTLKIKELTTVTINNQKAVDHLLTL